MKIFVICPVRGVTEEENAYIKFYIDSLERAGHQVHWPLRDTDQNDEIGLRICSDNRSAIRNADQVHVYWNGKSTGSLFDLGMAFDAEKPIILMNIEQAQLAMEEERRGNIGKSFNKFIYHVAQERVLSQVRTLRRNANCPKAQNGALIVKCGEIIGMGNNSCEPKGESRCNKISECPRMHMPSGTSYEVCHIVHAEVAACLSVRPNRSREDYELAQSHNKATPELISRLFTSKELTLLSGATLYLSGHYYACEMCTEFYKLCGISDIVIDPLFEGIMKNYYKK